MRDDDDEDDYVKAEKDVIGPSYDAFKQHGKLKQLHQQLNLSTSRVKN